MYIEKQHKAAVLIWVLVSLICVMRVGLEESMGWIIALSVPLVLLLFYRFIAAYAHFGFWESKASDYGHNTRPEPYAFLFWMMYLIMVFLVLRKLF